jgi:hypothetical protein
MAGRHGHARLVFPDSGLSNSRKEKRVAEGAPVFAFVLFCATACAALLIWGPTQALFTGLAQLGATITLLAVALGIKRR